MRIARTFLFSDARFKASLNFTEPEKTAPSRFFGIVQLSCPAAEAVQFIFCMMTKVPVQPLSAFTPDSTFLRAGYKVPSIPAFHENAVSPVFLPLNRTEHSGVKTVCPVQAECKRLSGAKLPRSGSIGIFCARLLRVCRFIVVPNTGRYSRMYGLYDRVAERKAQLRIYKDFYTFVFKRTVLIQIIARAKKSERIV